MTADRGLGKREVEREWRGYFRGIRGSLFVFRPQTRNVSRPTVFTVRCRTGGETRKGQKSARARNGRDSLRRT